MIQYPENSTATTALVGDNTSSTGTVRTNTAAWIVTVSSQTSLMSDAVLLSMIQAMKKAEEIAHISMRPKFDRVMKTRNTDGRPVRYSTWKPVRMLCGRDNIGTRNFRKVN